MKKNTHAFFAIVIASLLTLIGIAFQQGSSYADQHTGLLQVHMLNVGQGDAILIQTPDDETILIDGGPDATVLYEMGNVLPFYNQRIDHMILTHPHDDHVHGLNDVLDRYEVGIVYHSGVLHTVSSYIAWLQKLIDYGIEQKIITEPEIVTLSDDLRLTFLAPIEDFSGQRVDHLNNTSLVVRLEYKNISFLFTGDMEEELEADLLEEGLITHANVLKAGHHGSNTSSSQDFVDNVRPEIVLISAGVDNQYHHPHGRTVRRFEREGIEVHRTDLEGTITVYSDGESVWVD